MKNILLIFFTILFPTIIYSQQQGFNNTQIELPIPENPNVQRFDKVEYSSNDLSKGKLSINVSLLDIEIDEFNLPIELNYDATGRKVSEEASFIGLGWSLQFPNIIQTINDENDFTARAREILEYGVSDWSPGITNLNYKPFSPNDLVSYRNFPTNGIKSKNFAYYYLSRYDFPYNDKLNSLYNSEVKKSYNYPYLNIIDQKNGIDSEADFFSVNLIGNSTILFNNYEYENGTIKKESPLINIDNFDYNSPTISVDKEIRIKGNKDKIIAYDKKGNTYIFDKKAETRSYSDTFNPVTYSKESTINGSNFVSQVIYYPTKIISISGEVIDIEYILDYGYGRTQFSSYLYYTETASTQLPFYGSTKGDAYCKTHGCSVRGGQVGVVKNHQYIEGHIYIPKKIKYNGNEVIFNYSERIDTQVQSNLNFNNLKSHKLDNIEVYDFNQKLVKKIELSNSYFDSKLTKTDNNHTPPLENDLKRLRLDHIKINNEDYRKFVYNSINLPSKNSYSIDYWGYYNGADFNTSYAPNPDKFRYLQLNKIPGNGNNRSARLQFSQANILEEIHYPTKGYERFEYELNEYISNGDNRLPNWDNNDNNVRGVGLRVKSQKLFSNNNELLKSIFYKYEEGNLPMRTSFFRINSYTTLLERNSADPEIATLLTKNNYSLQEMNKDNFYSSSLFTSNNYVYYKKVISETKDSKIESNSFKKESYFENNNFKTANFNPTYTDNNSYFPHLNNNEKVENGTLLKEILFNSNNDTILQNTYKYNINESRLSYSIKVNSVGSLYNCIYCSTTNFQVVSSNRSLLTFYPLYLNKTVLDSKETIEYFNEKVFSSIKYNYSDDNNIISTIETNNNETIKTDYNYLHKLLVGKNIYRDNILISKQISDVYNKTFFVYGDTSFMTNIIRLKYKATCKGNSENCYITKINQLNNKNKPVEYIQNESITSFIWGYNGQYPIAKIEGASYSEISDYISSLERQSNEGLLNEDSFSNLRNELSDALITGYIYKPLVGVTKIIQPNGMSENYIYDNANRLKEIRNNVGELIKSFDYNVNPLYASTPRYYNTELHYSVYKHCENNQFSDPVIYTINANSYQSLISVEDANILAQNSEQQTSQNYANNIGVCTTYDCQFTKNQNFNFGFSSLGISSANIVRLQGVFYVSHNDFQNANYKWYEGVQIGHISGNCRPLVRQYFTSDYINPSSPHSVVKGFVEPDGRVFVTLLGVIANTYVQFDFKYTRR